VIGYAGLSHLGLVSAVAAAAKGFEVVGYDPDAALVESLAKGALPVLEPGLPELLTSSRSRLRFTSAAAALAACDVIYVAVDVPTDAGNRSDSTPVETLLRQVVAVARADAAVVVLSQVRPGFTRAMAAALPHRAAGTLFYQVETLIFGRAVERAVAPERFMVGCADPSAPLPSPYAAFLSAFRCPVLPMRYESAELCKISINMFLVASVSTTNMLAEVCERIGADWAEIAPALRLDRRIGPHAYLTPGLGVGGGNLTRDLATVQRLAAEHGTDAGVIEAWNHNTRHRRDWALMTLHRHGLRPGSVVAVWGLAYIPNTTSMKNSPGMALIEALAPVAVRAYDPAARLDAALPHAAQLDSAVDACAGADALAIMTAWPAFAEVDLARVARTMRGRLIVDPWNVLAAGAADAHGFVRARLGAPVPTPALTAC
jgi:UDPglucose 6-dehydrogenase